MQILGCLFSFLFIALFVVLAFGLSILDFIFRLFGINLPISRRHHSPDTFQSTSEPTSDTAPQQRVFDDSDGEYVDFEEVK